MVIVWRPDNLASPAPGLGLARAIAHNEILPPGSPFIVRVRGGVDGNTPIAGEGDILRVKAWNGTSILDNWLKVEPGGVSVQADHVAYTVTRQGGTPGVFGKGTSIINYGGAGQGVIILSSDNEPGPYVEIATHQGTFTGGDLNTRSLIQTRKLRLGNLRNTYGFDNSQDRWGLGAGEYGVAGKSWALIEDSVGVRLGHHSQRRVQVGVDGVVSLYDGSGNEQVRIQSDGMVRFGRNANSHARVEINSGRIQIIGKTAGGADETKIDLQADGDIFIGRNTGAAASTAIAIFNNSQTYNGEVGFAAGDILIGDNSANKSNVFWDQSTGEWNFRGGTTRRLWIDNAGRLRAGGGSVILDENGIQIVTSTDLENNRALSFTNGSSQIRAQLYNSVGLGGFNLSGFYSSSIPNFDSIVFIDARAPSDRSSQASLLATTGVASISLNLVNSSAGVKEARFLGVTDVRIPAGGLNVGNVTGAAVGRIKTESHIESGGQLISSSYAKIGNAQFGRYSCRSVTINASGAQNIEVDQAIAFGFFMIYDQTDAGMAFVVARGGAQATTIIWSVGSWSTTSGTLNSTNIYWNAGTSSYRIQNMHGSSHTYTLHYFGF